MTETNGHYAEPDLPRIIHSLQLDVSSMASRLSKKDRSENAQIKMMLQTIGRYVNAQVMPLRKEIADLKKQVAELQEGGVRFSGTHQRGNEYRRGEICSYDNSLWVALVDVKPMEIPGKCAAWQLALRGHPDPRLPTRGGARPETTVERRT
jgi:hypothetical protein